MPEEKSFIVSGGFLQADTRGIELVIFFAIAVALAWIVAEVLSAGIAIVAQNSGKARHHINAIDKRAAIIPSFKKRRGRLSQVVEQKNDETTALDKQRNLMLRGLNKINKQSAYLIREVGSNLNGTKAYTFSVSNRYVTEYVSKGQKHPLLDDSWKSGQLVVVWAKSLMDARVVVADIYSATAGYVVQMLKDKEASPSLGT